MVRKNRLWSAVIPIAFVWFGFHVGPTFCSGALNINYYIGAGATGMWLPLLTYAICGLFIYVGLTVAFRNHASNYDEFFTALYPRKLSFLRPIWNVAQGLSNIIGTATMLSFGSTLINTWFGLPNIWGVIITLAICFLVIARGQNIFSKISTVLSALMVACVIFASVYMMSGNWDTVVERISTNWTPEGVNVGTYARKAAVYGCTSIMSVVPLVNFMSNVTEKRQCGWVTLLGVILAMIMITFLNLMLLPFAETLSGVNLPAVELTKQYIPWLSPIYSIILYVAMLTSVPVFIMNEMNHWRANKKIFPDNGNIKSEKTKEIIVFLVIAAASGAISLLGFRWFVNVWLQISGIIGFILVGLPLIYAAIRMISGKDLKKN